MAETSEFVSLDTETISPEGKEHLVKTSYGSVSVSVVGDQDKPALITYPDLALNYMSCFQGLFFCPEAFSLIVHNFCVYHITPPGHELGAAVISIDDPMLSVDDLSDQIAEVLEYFGLGAVLCMGVIAGAYILTLFAIKHADRVLGLILVSPLCKAPSWTEWLQNKMMSNLLHFYGMSDMVKEILVTRYFSKEVRGYNQVPESHIVQTCRRLLDERQGPNVWRFLDAINRRPDITEELKKLQCPSLIFVGDESPFHSEALHMTSKLDRRYHALVEVCSVGDHAFHHVYCMTAHLIKAAPLQVHVCGSMVTEEQPHAMLIPLEHFLMPYGFYTPSQLNVSPKSTLNPTCIAPELYSPQSMGLKLKPIKTRVSTQVDRR